MAASVRARLLANRRIGSARALELARSEDLPAALAQLTSSPYSAGLTPDLPLEAAQRTVAATLLWNLRLIAGWLPPGGVQAVQPLTAWFELANIEERIAGISGAGHSAPYQLGRLDVAWRAVARATTLEAVRAALASSRWGDPGDVGPEGWMAVLRLRWAAWVAASVPGADVWAAAAGVLLAARLRFSFDPPVEASLARRLGLPPAWWETASVPDLRARLTDRVAWVLEGIESPSDLWRAEPRWWSRVRHDSAALFVSSRFGAGVIAGAAGLLAHDAWLTRAALAAAARGGEGRRIFDAVA
ncbi:MAG TPA: hypothetical protein VEU76_05895 [Candidatus Udaeobacter sp.]|nr:hypothetical protein [Candidatus Udaeobacter sp.]